ncbi:MAG: dethiobiotin synthase [Cytophagaceae bacterium]|nr:dethiobiotin synthase [Cytophagaceae bacterium]
MNKYFITAIGTNSGKTIVSAILTQALQADYWKPVQAGIEERDSDVVNSLLLNDYSVMHPERFCFKKAASPHEASAEENIQIQLSDFRIPETAGNDLIIEGAGGVMVPLNEHDTITDLALVLGAEVILVSNYYLGSINHTLLSYEYLKKKNVRIKGIIFNGPENASSKSIILAKTGLTCLLDIKQEKHWDPFLVQQYAVKLFDNWNS